MSKKRIWDGNFKIKATYILPGCRVEVRWKTRKEMAEDTLKHGVWVYDHEEDFARIYLCKDDPIEVQRYTLVHELQHAFVEILDVLLENYPDCVQTLAMSMVEWIDESPRKESVGKDSGSAGAAGRDIYSQDCSEETSGGSSDGSGG